VSADRLLALVAGLRRDRADAVVLLATDLPTFKSIATMEQTLGIPVLTSNQTILWRALRAAKCNDPIPGLGRIFHA
jgi:maleate cis-trans isomerase